MHCKTSVYCAVHRMLVLLCCIVIHKRKAPQVCILQYCLYQHRKFRQVHNSVSVSHGKYIVHILHRVFCNWTCSLLVTAWYNKQPFSRNQIIHTREINSIEHYFICGNMLQMLVNRFTKWNINGSHSLLVPCFTPNIQQDWWMHIVNGDNCYSQCLIRIVI